MKTEHGTPYCTYDRAHIQLANGKLITEDTYIDELGIVYLLGPNTTTTYVNSDAWVVQTKMNSNRDGNNSRITLKWTKGPLTQEQLVSLVEPPGNTDLDPDPLSQGERIDNPTPNKRRSRRSTEQSPERCLYCSKHGTQQSINGMFNWTIRVTWGTHFGPKWGGEDYWSLGRAMHKHTHSSGKTEHYMRVPDYSNLNVTNWHNNQNTSSEGFAKWETDLRQCMGRGLDRYNWTRDDTWPSLRIAGQQKSEWSGEQGIWQNQTLGSIR